MTVLIEAPLARAIIDRIGQRQAIPLILNLGHSGIVRDKAALAVGSKIEHYEDGEDIIIQCVLELKRPTRTEAGHCLDDGIYWDNMGVVARGHAIPESTMAIALGKDLRSIVDHPFLDGITVSSIRSEEELVLVVETEDCLWTTDRIEAEL